MKKPTSPASPAALFFLGVASLFLTSCATDSPPRPRHIGPEDYMLQVAGSVYVGESEDHAFRRRPDGSVIYADTADLPPTEQAKVRSAGMTYSGPGSKVGWH